MRFNIMKQTIKKEDNLLSHNTTEEWEKEFEKTVGLGLYTNEYGYVHKIPNYEAIKQFVSKIYNKNIDIDEIKQQSHNLALSQVLEKLEEKKFTEQQVEKQQEMGEWNCSSREEYNEALDDAKSIITSLQKE